MKIVTGSGRHSYGTMVLTGKRRVIFPSDFSPGDIRRVVKNLGKSLKAYRRFNWRNAGALVRAGLDFTTPLIKIGKVPIVTYLSNKEGKMRAYQHETKVPPTLYLHPSKPIGLLLGGSLKARKWLED